MYKLFVTQNDHVLFSILHGMKRITHFKKRWRTRWLTCPQRLYWLPINNFDMILFQKLCILCYFLHRLFFLEGHICQYLLFSSLNSHRKCQLFVDKSWLNNSPKNSCLSAFAKNRFFSFLFLSEEFATKRIAIFDKEKLCT